MQRVLSTVLAIGLSATHAAAWDVRSERDHMTDRVEKSAVVSTLGSTLVVACMNGRVEPRLSFDRRIGYGDIGVSYRIDAGPVVQRMSMLGQDGRDLWPWLGDAGAAGRLRTGKRLRVQVGREVFDFDLAKGSQKDLPAINCRG